MSLKTERIKQPVVTGTTQPLLIGGISDSDSKLTINTDGSITATTAVTVPSLVVNSKNVASNLLAEYIVTGSAVTSINFNGLDINTHKSYRVEFDLYSAGESYLLIYINGDQTASNYYSQTIFANSTSVSGERVNGSRCGYLNSGTQSSIQGTLQISNGYPTFQSHTTFNSPSSVNYRAYSIMKTATVANITQITILATASGSIGVGSKIRIYRGDV